MIPIVVLAIPALACLVAVLFRSSLLARLVAIGLTMIMTFIGADTAIGLSARTTMEGREHAEIASQDAVVVTKAMRTELRRYLPFALYPLVLLGVLAFVPRTRRSSSGKLASDQGI